MDEKEVLIEKLKASNLNQSQLNEIESVLNGEITEHNLLSKLIDLAKPLLDSKSGLKFRYVVFFSFIGLIVFLSIWFPNSEVQVWASVGTLIGFVFGQGSQLLK
jgi:hypothetical protein